MPQFGTKSIANLAECHPDLQRLFNEVIKHWDCTIIDGARTLAEQRMNVAKGVSKTMASKHLPQKGGKSHAADVMPYPVDWPAIERGLNAVKRADGGMEVLEAYMFQGFVAGVASQMGIKIRQGVDWNSNREFDDQTFHDLPHTELDVD
jgi:peptidoglycan LD-endopeptidase CwlK